jgi:translocation and assembly module TamA
MLRREIGGAWVYSYHARLLSEDWNVGPDDLTADYLLGGITLSRRERRVGTVDPREGFSQFYVAEGATESLGSDDDIVRLRARWTWVTSPGERHRIVARGEAGALLGQNRQISEQPPSLGFFAGGDDSLRGYGYQSIGEEVSVEGADGVVRTLTTPGNRLLLGSIEYQYYINQSWRVATFVDTGDAFTDSDFDFNAGVGFGVHYLTPVGAIRLELANSVTRDQPEWRFHINIGAEL